MQRIVIVGATSSIAQHCARHWLQGGAADMVLVGRDAARLETVAADLRIRSPQSTLTPVVADFLDAGRIAATVAQIAAAGAPDIVLVAHGWMPGNAAGGTDLAVCREALEVNAVSPALFAEAFARPMQARGAGILAIVGSVAGDRGRKRNYVYGAAKALVERYAEGLRHRLAFSGVKVVLIKPGPTATPMTLGLAEPVGALAPVEAVAGAIVRAIARGVPVAYVPGRWRPIMWVVRHLPRFVFDRLDL